MTKFHFISAMMALMALPVLFAQSDKIKEQKDDLTMRTPPPVEDQLAPTSIHQEIDFTANPQRVYDALLDAKQFAAFSGKAAEIDRKEGGTFSLFNGHIVGRNVELVPNQRIVQAWRVVTWAEGTYSIARFQLTAKGAGTHLIFDHTGFPEGLHDHLAQGWEEDYWSLLKKYLH